jgi:hypothetical protein
MIITHNGTILTNDGVVLNNIITSPSFINTYSLDFDGVDDYVNIGNGVSFEYTDSFSFSTWINPSAKSGVKYLYSKYISGKGILIYLNSSSTNGNNTLHFNLYNTNSGTLSGRKRITTSDFNFAPINTWVNIVLTYDGSGLASGINYYKNGVLRASSISQDNLQNQTIVNTEDAYLSSFNGVSSFLLGNQDEFAIYDSELSADDALAIYGTGQPTDLTNLNPIAWYRMGDNGTYKSPQWLIPSNENKDKVSNYSMAFDGVGDKVSIGTTLDLGINSTLSFWIKRGRISTSEVWFGEDSYSSDYLVTITSSTILYFRINTSYVGWNYPTVKSILNNTTEWVNVCIVRSGNSVELFLNGISYGNGNSNAGTPGSTATRFDTIGASPYGLHTFAQFDEIVAWSNNTVNPVDIYNGGTPTTISGAVAHYKMGEDANFTSNWLVDNSALDNYSKRSFSFDGVDDYVNIPNNTDLNFSSDYSVSFWINTTSTALLSPLSNQSKFLFRLYAPANQIRLQLYDGSGGFLNLDNTQAFNDGQWHHIAFTTEATTTANKVIVYFDGAPLTNKGTQLNVGSQLSAFAYEIGRNSGTWNFNGGIDEVSLYDSELSASQISDIYNGGTPTTLLSGAVAHYRMGEDASFNGTNWTVPDNVGTNNGTSNGMMVDALVGEAPNYSSGGISNGMTIEDRIGESPNSKNNAVSYNMDLIDRVEDTPTP